MALSPPGPAGSGIRTGRNRRRKSSPARPAVAGITPHAPLGGSGVCAAQSLGGRGQEPWVSRTKPVPGNQRERLGGIGNGARRRRIGAPDADAPGCATAGRNAPPTGGFGFLPGTKIMRLDSGIARATDVSMNAPPSQNAPLPAVAKSRTLTNCMAQENTRY